MTPEEHKALNDRFYTLQKRKKELEVIRDRKAFIGNQVGSDLVLVNSDIRAIDRELDEIFTLIIESSHDRTKVQS